MTAYDAVVIGTGATGSAVLYHLARRGLRVLGLERFSPGHDRGSSHGRTRIIRLGYFEDPAYVPLLRRAYASWREVEEATGRRLLHVTGIVEIGPPDGVLVAGTLGAARLHGLPHEVLDANALMRRLPAFRLPAHFLAVLQPDGGFLDAEPAVHAHIALAIAAGAELRSGIRVRAIEPRGAGVRILLDGETIEAGQAVVAAGPWAAQLLPRLGVRLRVTRQVIAWLAPHEPEPFAPGRFPVFLLESEHGMHYGFPLDPDGGMKLAKHHHRDQTVDPDAVEPALTRDDEDAIRSALAAHLPGANGPVRAAKTCLYTMAPDGHFIIDRLPDAPQILLASACSGHGFKFAGVIGEILADLVSAGTTPHDISRFRLDRFG
jgi:sarcosine oxidase